MIRIKVKDDPYFRREGSDIHTDRYITVTQVSNLTFKIMALGYYGLSNKLENTLWRCKCNSRSRNVPRRYKETLKLCN